MKHITRAVWILSFVSLFTDISSEMLYPVMPVYLKSIGFSVFLIGLLEGFAEALAGLSKGYFGRASDLSGKRLPFVQAGYLLSAISKPLLSAFVFPLWVFFARTIDRLGKGIRTGARDAILSDESTPETKARVFGLHRAMDTLGAALGPILALIYLNYHPENYNALFLLAFIPGIAGVLISLLLKEKKIVVENRKVKNNFFSFLNYWKESSSHYRKLVSGLLIFTLFNSSDVFLLLMLKYIGMSDVQLISAYIFYNLVFAVFAYPAGVVADALGLKRAFLIGLFLFAVVYGGMALNTNPTMAYALFFVYGMFAAFTDGVSKAWISNIAEKNNIATAIGTYTAFNSIFSLLASTFAGFIWYTFGASTTFMISSAGALLVMIYFFVSGIRK